MTVPFNYHLIRSYFEADPDAPIPPLGCCMEFDDFQVSLNEDKYTITITLTGQQIRYLKEWGWPDV